ncbi:hypothetical protein COOONC_20376 [Cooperia oncophora]
MRQVKLCVTGSVPVYCSTSLPLHLPYGCLKQNYVSGEENTSCLAKVQSKSTVQKRSYSCNYLNNFSLSCSLLAVGFLPKGDISREQLSQILLAYLAISSDIVEFSYVFKEKLCITTAMSNRSCLLLGRISFQLSLLQFPFVLTVSRARKMRVAITKTYEELIMPHTRPPNFWEIFYDVDIWAIILANSLQDIPFLLVRLYLMLQHSLVTYTMIFFTCKNALIIALQTYR